MKIAIACHPTYGGSGVVAAELGMELARRGHEVHYVSYEPPFRVSRVMENIFFHDVEVLTYPLFRYPSYALPLAAKLTEVIRAHGVGIMHAHYAIPHSISAILAKQMCRDCGVRIVTTLHGTDITLVGNDRSFYEITRFGIEESDAVTAVSEYLARETHKQFAVTRAISVVPNFVDTEIYAPERRSEALRRRFAAPNERLLVHISNFRRVKRVLDVVEVFARIARATPARLLMVGAGPDLAAAELRLAELGLKERASFVGPVADVAELLACGDLFLLPSESESFGLAALEAMACGVPVIGTRAGGLPELIQDGESGILAEIGAVEEMARRGLELLEDVESHRAMSRTARDVARRRFPIASVVDRYVALYEEVSAAGGAR